MGQLIIPGETGQVSDGFHTFDELYEHRCQLFAALMHCRRDISWKAGYHSDGTMFDGWFIAGMDLPTGRITYHLPATMWNLLGVPSYERAPEWDGHTPQDVVSRLNEWNGMLRRDES